MLTIRTAFLCILLLISGCQQAPNHQSENEYWSEAERNTLASFSLTQLKDQLNTASNRFATNKDAAFFGKKIFFDKRFSINGKISCASCHQEDKAFTDGLAKAKGVHKTGRNTQSIVGAAYHTWFYWDGRKDSLWSQALVPFEAADEMASSRVKVLRIVGSDKVYRQHYEQLFGQFPELVFNASIEADAGPLGDQNTRDNWYRIPVPTQAIINKAYANVGKAIAAYERTIQLPNTAFDQYLNALLSEGSHKANTLINQQQLAGMKLFIDPTKTHCLRCHNGPLFTNEDFHNIGTGNFSGKQLDFGRYFGVQAVKQDEFNCLGRYSDARPEQCHALRFLPNQVHGDMQGAFKAPSLRYLNKTAPYFHDGRFNQLNDVLNHYVSINQDESELPALTLSAEEKKQLIAFLELLNHP